MTASAGALTAEQREAFIAASVTLARAFQCYRDRTGIDAVLVGGATVVIFTGGQFFTGDFDFVASNDEVMAACLEQAGFRREEGDRFLRMGWYHPDHPMFGFQQVSGSLFDGRTEHRRLLRVDVQNGELVTVPPVEDLIADRLGQQAVASPTDTSRLEQARALLAVLPALDRSYLLRRVEEEGGDIGHIIDYLPPGAPTGQEGRT